MFNTKFAIAALAVTLSSGAAFAQSADSANWDNTAAPVVSVHAKTRADVQAELQAARASGELARYDQDSVVTAQLKAAAPRVVATKSGVQAPVAGTSREAVRAELQAARRNGELNPFDNDPVANGSAYVAAAPAHTTVAAR